MATLRRYGVSLHNVRSPAAWGEACDLVEAALNDTGTELFAAVAGWRFPMSMPEMLMVTSAYGKDAHKVMPFDPEGSVTDAEISDAHEELLNEIKFS